MFGTIAHAQAAAGQAAQPGMLEMAMPIIFVFGIMYLLVIRPQTKKVKEHAQFVQGLKKGDEVLTTGGLLGTIVGLTDEYITLSIAQDVNVRVLRSQVSAVPKKGDK